MFTLTIEHAISDFATWKGAFDRFSGARAQAGVQAHRIRHPVDDPNYLVIELDFDTAEGALAFGQFLRDVVWSTPDASPALVGRPVARLLVMAEEHAAVPERTGDLQSTNQ